MGWTYTSNGRTRRLSPEASAKLDRMSDTIWSAFDQAFVVARADKPAAEAPKRPRLWRMFAAASAFTWLAVLLWLDRHAL